MAVLTAFQKSYPNHFVRNYDTEVVDGVTHYELEIRVDSNDRELIYLEDGTLLQYEEDIDIASLPGKVVESIMKAHGGCEIDEAVKITRGNTFEYEVEIEVGEKDLELLVSSDGKILNSKEITSESEDSDESAADGDDEEDSVDKDE